MKKMNSVRYVSYVSNDGRTISVGYCKENGAWVLKGRRPHKKALAIAFKTETMGQIIQALREMAGIPEIQEDILNSPKVTWKRYKPAKKPEYLE